MVGVGGKLCICYVYMHTDSTSVSVIDSSYEKLKKDMLSRREGLHFLEVLMLE